MRITKREAAHCTCTCDAKIVRLDIGKGLGLLNKLKKETTTTEPAIQLFLEKKKAKQNSDKQKSFT